MVVFDQSTTLINLTMIGAAQLYTSKNLWNGNSFRQMCAQFIQFHLFCNLLPAGLPFAVNTIDTEPQEKRAQENV